MAGMALGGQIVETMLAESLDIPDHAVGLGFNVLLFK